MCNIFELTHVPACGKTAVSGSKIENKKKKAMTNNLESKEVLSAEILNAINCQAKRMMNRSTKLIHSTTPCLAANVC